MQKAIPCAIASFLGGVTLAETTCCCMPPVCILNPREERRPCVGFGWTSDDVTKRHGCSVLPCCSSAPHGCCCVLLQNNLLVSAICARSGGEASASRNLGQRGRRGQMRLVAKKLAKASVFRASVSLRNLPINFGSSSALLSIAALGASVAADFSPAFSSPFATHAVPLKKSM